MTETSAAPAVRVLSGTVVSSLPDTARWPGLVDAWLTSYGSPRTRAGYAAEIRRWTEWCAMEGTEPLTADRPAVERYLRALEDRGESARTRARRLSAVSSAYRYAVSVGTLAINPAEHVRRPKVDADQTPTIGLTAAEARAMLDAAEAESPRTHALVALLLGAGLRVSEALTARAEDMGTDSGHRFLRVTGKGGKTRRVPLHPWLLHALEVQLNGRTEGLLLPTRTGGQWDRSEAWRAVRRVAAAAGITEAERISPHSLRHTAATLLLAQPGASLARVQDLLGHADPRTTQRYNRMRDRLEGSAGYTLGTLLSRP
jgi:site-specific recombinase XerD